jgi:hypothetical protein
VLSGRPVVAPVAVFERSKPTQTEPIPKQVVDIHLTGAVPVLPAGAALWRLAL